jgi:hypothetical protein
MTATTGAGILSVMSVSLPGRESSTAPRPTEFTGNMVMSMPSNAKRRLRDM